MGVRRVPRGGTEADSSGGADENQPRRGTLDRLRRSVVLVTACGEGEGWGGRHNRTHIFYFGFLRVSGQHNLGTFCARSFSWGGLAQSVHPLFRKLKTTALLRWYSRRDTQTGFQTRAVKRAAVEWSRASLRLHLVVSFKIFFNFLFVPLSSAVNARPSPLVLRPAVKRGKKRNKNNVTFFALLTTSLRAHTTHPRARSRGRDGREQSTGEEGGENRKRERGTVIRGREGRAI